MENFFQMNDFYQLCKELFQGWSTNHSRIQKDNLLNSLCDIRYPPVPYLIVENKDNPIFVLSLFPNINHVIGNKNINEVHKDYLKLSSGIEIDLDDCIDTLNPEIKISECINFAKGKNFNSLMHVFTIPFGIKNLDFDKYSNELKCSFTLFGYYLSLEVFLMNRPTLVYHSMEKNGLINDETWRDEEILLFQMNLAGFDMESIKFLVLSNEEGNTNKSLLTDGLNYVVLYQ